MALANNSCSSTSKDTPLPARGNHLHLNDVARDIVADPASHPHLTRTLLERDRGRITGPGQLRLRGDSSSCR